MRFLDRWFGTKPPPVQDRQMRIISLTVEAGKVWPTSYVLVTPFEAKVIDQDDSHNVFVHVSGPYALEGLETIVRCMLAEQKR